MAEELRETEIECPKGCGERLLYGAIADARKAIRGYYCPEHELVWTKLDLQLAGVIE